MVVVQSHIVNTSGNKVDSMGKYERMQKRKERKDAERLAKQRRHEEHTAGKPNQFNPKRGSSTWRRDQNGNIIFKNYLKFSTLSFVMIAGVIIIAVFLVVALVTNTETGGSCANPFCALFGMEDYKTDTTNTKFAPPTSGTTEARELPP